MGQKASRESEEKKKKKKPGKEIGAFPFGARRACTVQSLLVELTSIYYTSFLVLGRTSVIRRCRRFVCVFPATGGGKGTSKDVRHGCQIG